MNKIKFLFAAVGFILTAVSSVYAGELSQSTEKVKVDLITRTESLQPGESLDVIAKFTLQNGWHILSPKDPGDIGLPTVAKFNLPKGYRLRKIIWSLDEKFAADDIVQYGYSKTAYFQAKIKPNRLAKLNDGDTLNVGIDLEWLACKEECVPEQMHFDLDVPIRNLDAETTQLWKKMRQNAELSFFSKAMVNDFNFVLVLLMAFAGGIILNFMPCIFPILTIKVISLAHNAYHKKISRAKAGMYVLGVFCCFMIVATILYILRLQGDEIGWGFQLQSPIFVGVMILIFFLIFLMLMDILVAPSFSRFARLTVKGAIWNSFLTGFLSVLIASPCTAPFMGIAIGYTLSSPIYIYYPIFISLSLGYAVPFALAELFPKAIRKVLPKPGRWMDILKKIFAIPVFLTCVWLGWILYNQLNHHALIEEFQSNNWQEYDAVKISKLVAENKPVLIDFTAKWCVTCLVNKRMVLDTDEFQKYAKEKGITLFRADWTNRDEKISSALEFYGRNSIPLYVFYNGKNQEYVILPQLLTKSVMQQMEKEL